MASSRKSARPNKRQIVVETFRRALGEFLARVAVSGDALAGQGDAASPVKVGIAFSGGLDSSLLLHLARDCGTTSTGRPIDWHVFHVHHGLSGNADAWEGHCRATAQALGLPYRSVRITVARDGGGVEQAAREQRYAVLGQLCRDHGIGLLLTGHHRDDQAETVLMQALRGSGAAGLSGMAALQTPHHLLGPSVALGRPLLRLSRRALEAVADEFGIVHVHDESNDDPAYRRNAIRHHIAPLLDVRFPGYAAALSRTARHAGSAAVLLDDLARIDHVHCAKEGGMSVVALRALSPERANNLLRYWLHCHGLQYPSASRLDDARRQLLGAARDRQPQVSIGPYRLLRAGDLLVLQCEAEPAPSEAVAVQWRGEAFLDIPQWRGRVIFEERADRAIGPQVLLSEPLRLAPRAGHERLRMGAQRPSRSLKNLFQEAAIPAWRRPWCPLFYCGDVLLGVAELGMDVRHLGSGPGVVLRWESGMR